MRVRVSLCLCVCVCTKVADCVYAMFGRITHNSMQIFALPFGLGYNFLIKYMYIYPALQLLIDGLIIIKSILFLHLI